jgi:hypothetical protein
MPETRRKGRRRTHENPRPSPRAGAYAWGGDSPAGYRGRKAKGARRSECALPLPETGHGTGAGHCHLPPATLTAPATSHASAPATGHAHGICHWPRSRHLPPATLTGRPQPLPATYSAPMGYAWRSQHLSPHLRLVRWPAVTLEEPPEPPGPVMAARFGVHRPLGRMRQVMVRGPWSRSRG